jgi:hypothetical protein
MKSMTPHGITGLERVKVGSKFSLKSADFLFFVA